MIHSHVDLNSAIRILQLCQNATDAMCDVVELIDQNAPEDKRYVMRTEAAFIIGEIYGRIMRKLHADYPELLPDYLR